MDRTPNVAMCSAFWEKLYSVDKGEGDKVKGLFRDCLGPYSTGGEALGEGQETRVGWEAGACAGHFLAEYGLCWLDSRKP